MWGKCHSSLAKLCLTQTHTVYTCLPCVQPEPSFVIEMMLMSHFACLWCRVLQKQLAMMLGRQQIFLDLEDEGLEEYDDLVELISNSHLNTNFVALAREVSARSHRGTLVRY